MAMLGYMHWDALNRMTYFSGVGDVGHDDYAYRADGMRIWKNHASGEIHEEGEPDPGIDYISQYYYDGQMQVESYEERSNGAYLLTKYGIGARGIDYMETYNGSTTTVGFPIYDGHGNMIATIGRSASSPYYSTGDTREYDVWGRIRAGNTTGDPKPRYCANLGHVQDDESGLIYMRARYYEPGTGRFVSEDSARHSVNWYIYARNMPTVMNDPSGNEPAWIEQVTRVIEMHLRLFAAQLMFFGGAFVLAGLLMPKGEYPGSYMAIGGLMLLIGYLLYEEAYYAAGLVTASCVWIYEHELGGSNIRAGMIMFGEAGLACLGLLMGAAEGDPDNWVWGLP
ncbi:MAG: RHS repeat-associated core domain-containing protein [Armatimonadetes bacterium]|nr:RHS repeat-associated core domain-containing protein [Armatimonadota bacterium]